MGLIEDIAKKAGVELYYDSGLALVHSSDAPAFVDACETGGVQILGIDSFEISGSSALSRIDETADFSAQAGSFSQYAAAREFIAWLGQRNRYLEFVVEPGAS